MPAPAFGGLNLVVADMAKRVAFYRRLGIELDTSHPFAAHHVEAKSANGFDLSLDSEAFAKRWDAGWRGCQGAGGVVIGFALPSRAAVDERYADLRSGS